ncbi:hypothetical protein [Nonomuraea diastatica]|uniref:SDR family NAD(P)-dependent oxidoreductase n=1 Tax=Nonomuraea diastatica TaxID=1848329 RepID=A0A4R4WNP4_9ACTN|nr:hypothetical protein [Nonomuraea diastatica]TDD15660.1 hypothetical protein E1294_33815 [Nonomuraea diastatica]
MSRTILITGGTHGIGQVLARHHEERGDQVIAVGSRDADLSSLEQTCDLAERVSAEHPVIDALVLGAFRHHPRRIETEEGFEATFALYVLSRWLLAAALRTRAPGSGGPRSPTSGGWTRSTGGRPARSPTLIRLSQRFGASGQRDRRPFFPLLPRPDGADPRPEPP